MARVDARKSPREVRDGMRRQALRMQSFWKEIARAEAMNTDLYAGFSERLIGDSGPDNLKVSHAKRVTAGLAGRRERIEVFRSSVHTIFLIL